MTNREEFAITFNNQDVSMKDILNWYANHQSKKGKKPSRYRSAVYQLIIFPLLEEGTLVRLTHGLYHVQIMDAIPLDKAVKVANVNPTPLDPFEEYINSKLNNLKKSK